LLATLTSPASPAFATADVLVLLHDSLWGETSAELVRQFGAAATRLLQPLDFGDSYVDVVLRDVTLGGVPVAVFFQMDKATNGLKRVQLQPLGHEINPPAYRAIAAALNSELGRPDQTCITPPVPAAGFQAAIEERWQHEHAEVSVIFRDTTLQAFEGCLYGPASGWCGLHGQILVRVAPPAVQRNECVPPARRR
jgi:hypothetical protein